MRAQIFNPIGVVHGLFPVFSGNKRVARAKAVFCDKKLEKRDFSKKSFDGTAIYDNIYIVILNR